MLGSRIHHRCLHALDLDIGDEHLHHVRFDVQMGSSPAYHWPRGNEQVNGVDLSSQNGTFRRSRMRYDVGRDSDVFEEMGTFSCITFEMDGAV